MTDLRAPTRLRHIGQARHALPGEWVACEHPERPADSLMLMCHEDDLCAGCVIAVEAALAQGAGPWAGEYLDLVGEAETAAGRLAVPGRSEVTR